MNLPFDLIALREEYFTKGLRRIDLDPDPIKEFGIWFTAAVEVGISEMNAMALATVAENGQPTTRMVLLKGYDHDGFVFYTNYLSEKGRHLEKNPRAGLVIHWKELERQIRIDGIAEKVSRDESARYFHSRPIGSQLGAWVSHQSEVILARSLSLQTRRRIVADRTAGAVARSQASANSSTVERGLGYSYFEVCASEIPNPKIQIPRKYQTPKAEKNSRSRSHNPTL